MKIHSKCTFYDTLLVLGQHLSQGSPNYAPRDWPRTSKAVNHCLLGPTCPCLLLWQQAAVASSIDVWGKWPGLPVLARALRWGWGCDSCSSSLGTPDLSGYLLSVVHSKCLNDEENTLEPRTVPRHFAA